MKKQPPEHINNYTEKEIEQIKENVKNSLLSLSLDEINEKQKKADRRRFLFMFDKEVDEGTQIKEKKNKEDISHVKVIDVILSENNKIKK